MAMFNFDFRETDAEKAAARAERTRGILDTYRQEPAIPQGGVPLERYLDPVNAQGVPQPNMFQPRAQTDQAGLLNSLLGAGNTLQQAESMRGAMYPQQAQQVIDPAFLKEERARASSVVNKFNTNVNTMRTDYSKLQGLADAAKGGSRAARASMLINIARLNSPGVVTDTEAQQLTGGANPVATTLAYLKDNGTDVGKLLGSHFDPYGEDFDTDSLLNIGRSLVTSSAAPMMDAYTGAQERAKRAQLSDLAYKTNFGNNPNYNYLQEFTKQQPKATPKKKLSFEEWKRQRR